MYIHLNQTSVYVVLNIDVGSYDFTETGVDESRTMASIVQKLLSDGKLF